MKTLRIFILSTGLLFTRVPEAGLAANDEPSPVIQNRVQVQYGIPKYQNQQLLAQNLKNGKLLEGYADLLTNSIKWPSVLTLATASCGQVNAFYLAGPHAVVICYEFINDAVNTGPSQMRQGIISPVWYGGRPPTQQELQEFAAGLLTFVFIDETGHAMVNMLQLPVLGREEDVADQIAVYFMVEGNASVDNFKGPLWFNRGSRFFASRNDIHSWGPQRQVDIACWAYGGNPAKYATLIRIANVSPQRAQNCAHEYQQINVAVKELLGKYLYLK